MQTKMFFYGLFAVSAFLWHVVSGPDSVSVSAMERDSVTLHTDVKINQQEKIHWYFNGIRVAQLNGDQSYICTDVQCNEGTERFRDRLKLDHQTGSLTIMNIRTTDSGVYKLLILRSSSDSETIFSVTVIGVSAAERGEICVKEGGNVTLDPGVIKNPIDLMTWYFHDTCIAQITGDQSKICTDDQCDVRFRGRLEVNQTGSLTITNIRTTDSGLYHLQIHSRRFSITRSFRVTVTGCVPFVIIGCAVQGMDYKDACAPNSGDQVKNKLGHLSKVQG
ncbi:uncharacterized protein LOC109061256 isoform X2 [Cyprinus carpio]|uniref:Uncharacterized protein LOC109061256 isoform X2 n=1 Tax=Cyprinus carpio TaxID=7962 RepID=A0A9Q9VNI5_CYPCA|nr:uncharacterized protein LOC109061256 isoform X2 [Cyprinus carpio]XP_042568295.1 uncharacterized protein LOC109061256 isoform X2 [Cyprinus carpio]